MKNSLHKYAHDSLLDAAPDEVLTTFEPGIRDFTPVRWSVSSWDRGHKDAIVKPVGILRINFINKEYKNVEDNHPVTLGCALDFILIPAEMWKLKKLFRVVEFPSPKTIGAPWPKDLDGLALALDDICNGNNTIVLERIVSETGGYFDKY